MTLREYIKSIDHYFKNNEREYEAIKLLLIEKYYHSVANFYLSLDDEICNQAINDCNEYIISFIPVQYILGYSYFYNLKLKVNNNTLIPRGETEILVETALEQIKKNGYQKVLDVCTGSGAIALAIKNNADVLVKACDISKQALDVARENALNLNLDVEFIESDILRNVDYNCDLIVSNPPYISYNEYVDDLVLKNEPHIALFAEDEGLYFYKNILLQAKEKISDLKMIIFEIGYLQAKSVMNISRSVYESCDVEVIKDYSGKDRIVIVKL